MRAGLIRTTKPYSDYNMTIKAKICGLSTRETVNAAVAHGAAFLGFVFYEKSPRHVTPAQAAKLSEDVPDHVKRVALCVDADDHFLKEIIDVCEPDYLQLHGHESRERITDIRDRTNRPIMKAVRVSVQQDVHRAREFESVADCLLFDAMPSPADTAALPGGNALSFDWNLLSNTTWAVPWMLSGGLNRDNVKIAVRISGARMVDVSSGVESARGVKDAELIEEFLATVSRL